MSNIKDIKTDEDLREEIQKWYETDCKKTSKGDLKLYYWHHFNNMIKNIQKILNESSGNISVDSKIKIIDEFK